MKVDIQTDDFLSKIFGTTEDTFTTNQWFKYKPAIQLKQTEPNYFSISKTKSSQRTQENFISMHLLVLDDIGTKATPPNIPPSYIIETSPSNYQYGYLLTTPITDRQQAIDLILAQANSVYSDPNGNNITRLVRLPMGVNGKAEIAKQNFQVHLTYWCPENKYDYNFLKQLLEQNPRLEYTNKNKNTGTDTDNADGSYQEPDYLGKGDRNSGLTRHCGYLLSQGTEGIILYSLMAQFNLKKCKPPVEQKELDTIIQSITAKHNRRLQPILDNIYHIRAKDTWVDIRSMVQMSSNSLQITYAKEFPKKTKVYQWLPRQIEFNQCDDFTWSPVPYNHQLKTIQRDGKQLLNTWNGFAIDPMKGDVSPWLNHLSHVVPEPDYRRALLWWVAFTIQKPELKCNWQPVILGVSGAGKDALFRPIAQILGPALKTIGNKDIIGDYDDGLYQTKLLHISEAEGLRGKSIEFYKRITSTETTDMQMLNIKCQGKVMQQNIANVVVITNNIDAMKFSKDERRAFVLRSPDIMTEQQQTDYFDNWLDKNGAAYLFDYLLKYDLSEFKPSIRPYNTTHFDNLFETTKSDTDTNIEDFVEPYEVMLVEHIFNNLKMSQQHVTRTKIIVWLETNGFVRWDNNIEARRIKRRIDGVFCTPKSRFWYVKKDSIWYDSRPVDMCREVERVEAMLVNQKNKY